MRYLCLRVHMLNSIIFYDVPYTRILSYLFYNVLWYFINDVWSFIENILSCCITLHKKMKTSKKRPIRKAQKEAGNGLLKNLSQSLISVTLCRRRSQKRNKDGDIVRWTTKRTDKIVSLFWIFSKWIRFLLPASSIFTFREPLLSIYNLQRKCEEGT